MPNRTRALNFRSKSLEREDTSSAIWAFASGRRYRVMTFPEMGSIVTFRSLGRMPSRLVPVSSLWPERLLASARENGGIARFRVCVLMLYCDVVGNFPDARHGEVAERLNAAVC